MTGNNNFTSTNVPTTLDPTRASVQQPLLIDESCDLLEAAGHKVSETEHVLSIMNGLDEEYEAVVVVISSKETTPTCNMFIPPYLLMRVDYIKRNQSISIWQSISHQETETTIKTIKEEVKTIKEEVKASNQEAEEADTITTAVID